MLYLLHHMQATKYFLGTSLHREKLFPSNVIVNEISSDFDLLFISVSIVFRVKMRIQCLHGKKETSNAWCLPLLMKLIMERSKMSSYTARASYSSFRLIQSLGRICLARQNHDYVTVHIFDTGYDPSRSGGF